MSFSTHCPTVHMLWCTHRFKPLSVVIRYNTRNMEESIALKWRNYNLLTWLWNRMPRAPSFWGGDIIFKPKLFLGVTPWKSSLWCHTEARANNHGNEVWLSHSREWEFLLYPKLGRCTLTSLQQPLRSLKSKLYSAGCSGDSRTRSWLRSDAACSAVLSPMRSALRWDCAP